MQEPTSNQNRQFVCACGKNYLSYAALFTHIKQKHEGKAPGPIIRPRSERKRGRPRKNAALQNDGERAGKTEEDEESESLENGVQKNEDIYNNEQVIKPSTEQIKNKKSAQILGIGGFAFTAYKPDNGSNIKNEKSFSKKISKKVSKVSPKESLGASAFLQNQDNQVNFNDKIEKIIKNEFKKLFEGNSPQNIKVLLSLIEESPYLKFIDTKQQAKQRVDDFEQMTIMRALSYFLRQIKQTLSHDQDIKFEDFQQEGSKNNVDEICDYDQVLAMTSILLEAYQDFEKCSVIQELMEKPLSHLLQSFKNLFIEIIPKKIFKSGVGNFPLFQGQNPFSFILHLYNWIALHKNQSQLRQQVKRDEEGLNKMASRQKIMKEQEGSSHQLSESQPSVHSFDENQ